MVPPSSSLLCDLRLRLWSSFTFSSVGLTSQVSHSPRSRESDPQAPSLSEQRSGSGLLWMLEQPVRAIQKKRQATIRVVVIWTFLLFRVFLKESNTKPSLAQSFLQTSHETSSISNRETLYVDTSWGCLGSVADRLNNNYSDGSILHHKI